MSSEDHNKIERDEGYRYAKLAMTWHGWGSPIGLGLFIVMIGAFIYLLHASHIF